MANQRNFEKDPDAIIDYSVDWTDWLVSDTISTGTWLISPVDLVEVSASYTSADCTIFVSSGTVGQTYSLTNRITTANGRRNDQTIFVLVKNQ